ncbi:MAG: thioredoxin family protein [Holophagales bacterium]|nr:thioredoxin family protein [Holophagales bacterium]
MTTPFLRSPTPTTQRPQPAHRDVWPTHGGRPAASRSDTPARSPDPWPGIRPWLTGLGAAVLLAIAPAALAQQETANLEMFADRASYAPGDTVRLVALVEVDKGWHVNSNLPSQEWLIPTELDLLLPEGSGEPVFDFPPDKAYLFPFESEPVLVYEGEFAIYATFDLPADLTPGSVPLDYTFRYQSCNDRQCLAPIRLDGSFDLTVGDRGEATHATLFGGADGKGVRVASAGGGRGLAVILLLGLLGGLILNAMPCVLPVLSLKVFGLVKSAGEGRSHLVLGSLATTAGIVISFWALAGAAVLASAAGAAVGWGVQFQQPGFVAFLAVVVVLFSLNMWGLFEIPLPQSFARMGGSSPREGLAGHFASGLFATLMATPCSAPFLGTAVGFALAEPPAIIFLVFTAIGLGLALPYLLLAAVPGVDRLLPRPGPWMVTFRQVMGFLLAAAAVWLFYVLAGQISAEGVAFVQLALLALALAVWRVHGTSPGTLGRRLAVAGVVLLSIASVLLAARAPKAFSVAGEQAGLIDWIRFDEAEAERLASEENRMVFVDFTADWCLTCKANERLVLETPEVAGAFDDRGVVAMKADWTNRDDTIAEFLSRYGRSAVPFYLLYRPGQEPHVFGELLTKGGVLEVLAEASRTAEVAGGGEADAAP